MNTETKSLSFKRALGLAILQTVLTFAGGVPAGAAAAAAPLTVAVLDFKTTGSVSNELGSQSATLLNAMLSAEPDLILVERAELKQLLSEQELGLSGTVNSATAAKVGQLTGAKVLVTGRVFKAGKEQFLVAKVLSTETSRVYGSIAKGGADATISDLVTELSVKVGEVLREKGGTLVAKVLTQADLVAKIKAAIGDGQRPLLSIKIPEVHFGTPTVDPAAETEIGLIAAKCGFKLVDEKSSERARFEITGEAFSERGIRLGNLISCKARVEIKVRDRSTGRLAVVDRQTTVAVDLSEQIAAKNALQSAGAKLAERILVAIGK